MAHHIEATDSLAYFGETPWHGIGTAISEEARWDRKLMLKASGLDWEVHTTPSKWVDTFGNEHVSQLKQTNYRVINVDGQQVAQELGQVGPLYTILQNDKAFEFFDTFVTNKEASFHTAGSLKDGKIIWVLAELNREPLKIRDDDTVRKFLLLSHAHDGSKALTVGFTPIRVVCWNTLSMATGKTKTVANAMLRFKHSPGIHVALDTVKAIINTADATFEATAEQYRKLANCKINRSDLEKYVHKVLLVGSKTADEENPSTRMKNNIESVLDGIPNMRGGYDGTLWGAYNLMTEHLAWVRGNENDKTVDTRMSSLWMGGVGGQMNDAALKYALELLSA